MLLKEEIETELCSWVWESWTEKEHSLLVAFAAHSFRSRSRLRNQLPTTSILEVDFSRWDPARTPEPIKRTEPSVSKRTWNYHNHLLLEFVAMHCAHSIVGDKEWQMYGTALTYFYSRTRFSKIYAWKRGGRLAWRSSSAISFMCLDCSDRGDSKGVAASPLLEPSAVVPTKSVACTSLSTCS